MHTRWGCHDTLVLEKFDPTVGCCPRGDLVIRRCRYGCNWDQIFFPLVHGTSSTSRAVNVVAQPARRRDHVDNIFGYLTVIPTACDHAA